jgi:hypothetical protein
VLAPERDALAALDVADARAAEVHAPGELVDAQTGGLAVLAQQAPEG